VIDRLLSEVLGKSMARWAVGLGFKLEKTRETGNARNAGDEKY